MNESSFWFSAARFVLRKILFVFTAAGFVISLVTAATAQEKILIGGTGSALAAMNLLAEEYAKANEGIDFIIVPSLGSGGGIKALIAGKIHIALSARPVKDKEKEKGVAAEVYARAPMIFATHYSNAATNISHAQLQLAYAGLLSKWPDGVKLRPIMRPPTESDIKLIRNLSTEIDEAVDIALNNPSSFVALNDQDNASALERIRGSLGFLSLGQMLAERRPIKALSLENVVGSAVGVADGTYPLVKTHRMVLAQNCSAAVQSFVQFIFSDKGQEILTINGHVSQDSPDNIDLCFGAK